MKIINTHGAQKAIAIMASLLMSIGGGVHASPNQAEADLRERLAVLKEKISLIENELDNMPSVERNTRTTLVSDVNLSSDFDVKMLPEVESLPSPVNAVSSSSSSDNITFNENVYFKKYGGLKLKLEDNQVVVSDDVTLKANKTEFGFKVSKEYYLERNNDKGTSSMELVSTTRSICFLTYAGFEELESNDKGTCYIRENGNHWYLYAHLKQSYDSDAYCGARCLTY